MRARHLGPALAGLAIAAVAGGAPVRADAAPDVAPGPGPELAAEVAALPVLARLGGGITEVVVRGELSPARARRMVRLARAVYDDVNRRFVVPDDRPHPPGARGPAPRRPANGDRARRVELCLFDTSRAYDRFVTAVFGEGDHSSMGFYSPAERIVVANLARSVGNLRHELVHPLLGDAFPGLPAWLNEGLGSLYGTATPRRGGRGGFRFLVNYRLRHLRAARDSGQLPTLEELARSTYHDVHGPRVMAYYAVGRYLALYLDRRGQLDAFYRDLRARAPTAERQLAVLRAYVDYDEFLAWADGLEIPRRRTRPRR